MLTSLLRFLEEWKGSRLAEDAFEPIYHVFKRGKEEAKLKGMRFWRNCHGND